MGMGDRGQEAWIEDNKRRKAAGLPPLSFKEWRDSGAAPTSTELAEQAMGRGPLAGGGGGGRSDAAMSAKSREERIVEEVNKNAWDAPTNQQNILAALQHSYNPAVAGEQQFLAQMLMASAQGKGTSVAEYQMRAGANQNFRDALSAMASQRGVQNQGSLRAIQEQRTRITNRTNQDAALLRAQEMLMNRQLLGGLYGQMSNQNLANLGMTTGITEHNRDMNVDREKYLASLKMGANASRVAQEQAAADRADRFSGAALQTAGALAATAATSGAAAPALVGSAANLAQTAADQGYDPGYD